MAIPTGRAFAKALEEAGVVADLNTVERIVIDINGRDAVRVHVQRIGDKRLLEAFGGTLGMMLAETAPEPAVRYWCAFSAELLDSPDIARGLAEAGLRIAQVAPGRDPRSRMVLIEDAGAPAELAGKEVELTLTKDGDGRASVTERRVTG